MNWIRPLLILAVSVMFSSQVQAHNVSKIKAEPIHKDSLKIEQSFKFKGLMFLSLPKAIESEQEVLPLNRKEE